MTPLDKIRAACIAANPEIADLKFGCVFKNHRDENFMILFKGRTPDLYYFAHQEGSLGTTRFSPEMLEYDKTIKILGRPIRLSDVLFARHKKSGGNWLPADMNIVYALLQGVEGWDLRHDDASLQSEQTLTFIASVL